MERSNFNFQIKHSSILLFFGHMSSLNMLQSGLFFLSDHRIFFCQHIKKCNSGNIRSPSKKSIESNLVEKKGMISKFIFRDIIFLQSNLFFFLIWSYVVIAFVTVQIIYLL